MASVEHDHQSGDIYLSALCQGEGVLVGFILTFPGSASAQADASWLDNWFRSRASHFYRHPAEEPPQHIALPGSLAGAILAAEGLASNPFRLLDICPHHFRGFRSLDAPVLLPDGLVVIDGPNSSGKTSLAEAFEWLFTGELIRRTLQGQGAPRELENCICNQLRPDGEQTWVEATIQLASGEGVRLRRVLTTDYGPTSTAQPISVLLKNGKELSRLEEADLLQALASGSPPMLMQHTLRVFVHSSPAQRRGYFENLLRLDELTFLVEKAVVSNARLPDFPSPAGGVALAKWNALKAACVDRASKAALTLAERATPHDLAADVSQALLAAGKAELPDLLDTSDALDDAIIQVREKQRAERQQALPVLGALRPRRAIDDQLHRLLGPDEMNRKLQRLAEAVSSLTAARQAAQHVTEAHIAISMALDTLQRSGAVFETAGAQTCPLCGYEPIATLTPERIAAIRSWAPAREIIEARKSEVDASASAIRQHASSIDEALHFLVPPDPEEEAWVAALQAAPAPVAARAAELRQRGGEARMALAALDAACHMAEDGLSANVSDGDRHATASAAISIIVREAPTLIREAVEYGKVFTALDNEVGALSREDPAYRLREAWLDTASDQANLVVDLSWEHAKRSAQSELEAVRAALIEARQTILDARRGQFSEGMTEFWRELREDRYSAFSRLYVPEPRGRGFPIEIEVKAVLDDGTRQVEVDALRVFSESQVHALGIAAFLTRARLLGHRCLILDDPVQSMDEEHFRTFAANLLPCLLDQGIQVIVLTHNELFSRDVSHVFASSGNYTTLRIRHSRRRGCQVEEGNRRAAERLRKAEELADEGRLDDAWGLVRVAVERIYLCAMIKHGPSDFDPRSWSNQTAEYMWEAGVGDIVLAITANAGARLKDILELSVAGAHDTAPRGRADLARAARDLRGFMESLHIGAA